MLSWLFATQRFDVLLVNYTWLSKALDLAPRGVLRVLDTHDRFSGRRELLAANGLQPEFFYTSEAEEASALNRADVVWAIKEQEREFFATLTRRPVVTVPYVETLQPLPRGPAPNGILRFGIVGARNNVNLANVRTFLETARHYIERTLLPMEIHIAGSCCDDLAANRHPLFVRLIGRVSAMTDFYRDVDAVLAPMTFSTGLKIKVGEALSLGKAVIAHAHAFEGYRPTHAFHQLDSFQAIMWACKEVVKAPERISDLEDASMRSAMASARTVAASLDRTIASQGELQPGVCVVLDVNALRDGSLLLDHACEVAHYLGFQVPVHVLLAGRLQGAIDSGAAHRLARLSTVLVTPGLAAASAAALRAAFGGARLGRRSLAELAGEAHMAIWFAGPLPDGEPLPRQGRMPAFVSFDSFAVVRREAAFVPFATALRRLFAEVHLLSRNDAPEVSTARRGGEVTHHRAPLFYNGDQAYAMWAAERASRGGVLLLVDTARDPLLELTLSIQARYGGGPVEVILADGDHHAEPPPGVTWRDPDSYFREVWDGAALPELVVDIGTRPSLDALRDVLERQRAPRLALFRQASAPRPAVGTEHLEAAGLFASLECLRRALLNPGGVQQATTRQPTVRAFRNDPGWCAIWDRVAQAKASIEAE